MDELIKSVSIENMVAMRDAAAECIERAGAELAKAQEIYARIWQDVGTSRATEPSLSSHSSQTHRQTEWWDDDSRNEAIECIDARIWDVLMCRSGVLSVMSPSALKDWNDLIHPPRGYWLKDTPRPPQLTVDNVYATFAALRGKSKEMSEDTILEVIKEVSWNYRSNQPHKIGKRLVVSYALTYGSLDYDRMRTLDAFERAFCLATGEPIPDHNTGGHGRQAATETGHANCGAAETGEISRRFWRMRWFKNRNAHLYMTDVDAVDAVNRIVAKHFPNALPPKVK